MKYLHQVSYLRLQDEIGLRLSYYCLSGTTCVLVVVQYTAVYLVQRVYLSQSNISLHHCYCCVLGILYVSQLCVSWFCDHRACISDEYSAWTLGVLEIEENLFFRERFDAKYLHQVSCLLDACVHHTDVYPCLLYTSPSPRDLSTSRMPSSA